VSVAHVVLDSPFEVAMVIGHGVCIDPNRRASVPRGSSRPVKWELEGGVLVDQSDGDAQRVLEGLGRCERKN